MQVFKIEPRKSYTYGAAIVAARDSEEAIEIYCATEFREYIYYDCECECNIVVGLNYQTDRPTLIFDKIGPE